MSETRSYPRHAKTDAGDIEFRLMSRADEAAVLAFAQKLPTHDLLFPPRNIRRKVIETTELGHHEPSGKIRLGLRASFLGDTGVGARGHGGPIGSPAQNSPAFMAIIGQFAWVTRLTSGVPLGAWLGARGFALPPKPPSGRWTKLKGLAGRHR